VDHCAAAPVDDPAGLRQLQEAYQMIIQGDAAAGKGAAEERLAGRRRLPAAQPPCPGLPPRDESRMPLPMPAGGGGKPASVTSRLLLSYAIRRPSIWNRQARRQTAISLDPGMSTPSSPRPA